MAFLGSVSSQRRSVSTSQRPHQAGGDRPRLGRPDPPEVAVTNVLADAIVEGEIMDPGVVAEAVKGLLVSAGVRSKKAVVAVGGRDVIVRRSRWTG